MYKYYINTELTEEWPKSMPREFRFGETHRIQVIKGKEDNDTRVDNTLTDLDDAIAYYKDKDENEYKKCICIKEGSDDYVRYRKEEYGTIEQQIEYIVEHGVDKLQERNNAIKQKYKKA